MENITTPPVIRVPLLQPEYVESLGMFVQRCATREPTSRARLWAYGNLLTVYVSLRENVLVTRDAVLSDVYAIDAEVGCDELVQVLLQSHNQGVAYVDIPVSPVTFAIPWGDMASLGFVEYSDAVQVVTAGENILADTAANAGGAPDPKALQDLYEVLLEDVVFRVPDVDGSVCEVPLKALWVGAGMGLLSQPTSIGLQRQGDFAGAVFNLGNVWFHRPVASVAPQPLVDPDSGLIVE